jgi:hypothetical protein
MCTPDSLFVQISVFLAVGVQKTSHTPNSAQKDLDFCYDVLLGILEGFKHRDGEYESYFNSTVHIPQQGKLILLVIKYSSHYHSSTRLLLIRSLTFWFFLMEGTTKKLRMFVQTLDSYIVRGGDTGSSD